ncbi:T9SS sorting signal type C domain-containing protein [Flavobacterium sp. ZS1P70]|uniref:T9SS sorting signal type C domain-containing protein n=1 Tax=Flavobacterium zhoui TaxID=3230414 RepID=A0ABW6I6A0_9FLAO
MKIKIRFIGIFFISFLNNAFGQAIFENRIIGADPGLAVLPTHYVTGQTFDPNITVSGISKGSGLNGNGGDNRYNAKDWDSSSLDTNDYFEFTITPNAGYQINYAKFIYKAQVSATGPANFVFRSSLDNYIANIATPIIPNSASEVTPIAVDLSAFQSITTPITFRFYGWGGTNTLGTFSINDFIFNGVVSCATTAPSVGPVTQLNCTVATGTIELQGLPASGSWNLYQNNVLIVTGGTGSTTTVSGLSAGNYSYKVAVSSCMSLASSIVSIVSLTTSWNGIAWSNGIPTSTNTVLIDANYTTDASHPNIIACSLIVNSPNALTIENQYFVTIQNNLVINTGATLNIKNQGSLVMVNDSGTVTNNGTTTVNKTTTPFEKFDYTYWSTPVASTAISNSAGTPFANWRVDHAYEFMPQNFLDVAPADGFDDNEDVWSSATSMSPGKGYIIMGRTWGTFPATETVIFTGKVNNGIVKSPVFLTPGGVTDDDWNLVGNPYASAISADAFINANTSTISQSAIEGTLYFWTHKMDISASNPGPDAYNFSSDDYAVYNLSGGTGTQGSYVGAINGTGGVEQSNKPLGYIASGQGFFVEASVNGNVIFNNSMRLSAPVAANSQFYKTLPVKDKIVAKDRVWLNLENKTGMFSQQLIGYFDKATNGYDNGYDGLLNDGGNYINFYSFIDEGTYKIQGKSAFDEKDEVRLGYFSAVADTFDINIDSKEGVFSDSNVNIFVEDKLLNVIHDLKKEPYSFTTESGTFDDRFVLRYTDKILATGSFEKPGNTVSITKDRNELKIKSALENIKRVTVFDLLGRKVFDKEAIDTNEFHTSNITVNKQTVVVKVTLSNGQEISKKVIY